MRTRGVCLAVVAALVVTLHAGSARADLNSDLDNSIKGLVGCALLGANLTLIIEGAVGVRNPWLLSLIPIAVAGGGAAGGGFLGEASGAGAVATLVVGLAQTVPAAVLVAWAPSYRPAADDGRGGWVDRTVEGAPPDDEEGSRVEVSPVGGTATDVYGPDGDDEVAPPEDDDDAGDGDYEPEPGGGGPSFLSGPVRIPLPGVLGLLAEEARAGAPRLELSYY